MHSVVVERNHNRRLSVSTHRPRDQHRLRPWWVVAVVVGAAAAVVAEHWSATLAVHRQRLAWTGPPRRMHRKPDGGRAVGGGPPERQWWRRRRRYRTLMIVDFADLYWVCRWPARCGWDCGSRPGSCRWAGIAEPRGSTSAG